MKTRTWQQAIRAILDRYPGKVVTDGRSISFEDTDPSAADIYRLLMEVRPSVTGATINNKEEEERIKKLLMSNKKTTRRN